MAASIFLKIYPDTFSLFTVYAREQKSERKLFQS
jgi:hypothetical protein